MQKYLELYRSLELPQFAIELADGQHTCDWFEPARWRTFPPAFLPLFRHWNKDYGYWKHWFTPIRRMTIVEHQGVDRIGHVMSISEMIGGLDPTRQHELLVTEIASDVDQLVRVQVLDWLCNGAGDWTDEIRGFATKAGLTNEDISYIDSVSVNEDRPIAFLGSSVFDSRPPLSCYEDDLSAYGGDFPHPKMEMAESSLRNICSYEIHSSYMYDTSDSDSPEIRETIAQLSESPPWLKSSVQRPVFDSLLAVGDLSGAWMSLNSFAWVSSDAADALQRLADATNDEQFSLLAEAYCSLNHEEGDGY